MIRKAFSTPPASSAATVFSTVALVLGTPSKWVGSLCQVLNTCTWASITRYRTAGSGSVTEEPPHKPVPVMVALPTAVRKSRLFMLASSFTLGRVSVPCRNRPLHLVKRRASSLLTGPMKTCLSGNL